MNISYVWNPPLWKVGLAHLEFWSNFSRPMGAIYYLPLFKLAGFNPVPYHVVRLALLLANTWIFYYLALSLTRSWWLAALATVPIAYHAGLAYLAYSGAFIYDILCGGFYFAALLYYVRLRKKAPRCSVLTRLANSTASSAGGRQLRARTPRAPTAAMKM